MCQSPDPWALTQINNAASPNQNGPEVVHIGVCRPCDDQIAQGLKKPVRIVALKALLVSLLAGPAMAQSVLDETPIVPGDFGQGALEQTSRALDFAIEGDGAFFAFPAE